jgi:hypothetical protein
MLLFRHQNAGQSYDIKITKRCFENMAKFRYLGTTITNQNLIQEKIKRRLNSGNGCIKEVEMGMACSTNGGDEECVWDIGGKARRKKTVRTTKT